jgi:hypothetical protein
MRAIAKIARMHARVVTCLLEWGSLLRMNLQILITRRTVARGTFNSHFAIDIRAVARCYFINN